MFDLESIKKNIREKSAKDIYDDYLLGPNVWLFEKDSTIEDKHTHYHKFKKLIADKLELHIANITIIGSAKTKHSFTPAKNFKNFTDDSDIDVVIVSSKIFDRAWAAYREAKSKHHINNYRRLTSDIFRQFVSLKDTDYDIPFFKNWSKRYGEFNRDFQVNFGIENELNYRIYRSWDAVAHYHIEGILTLQNSLITTEDT